MSREEALRALYLLRARVDLHLAGVRTLRQHEWNIVKELAEWYRTTGHTLCESRRDYSI